MESLYSALLLLFASACYAASTIEIDVVIAGTFQLKSVTGSLKRAFQPPRNYQYLVMSLKGKMPNETKLYGHPSHSNLKIVESKYPYIRFEDNNVLNWYNEPHQLINGTLRTKTKDWYLIALFTASDNFTSVQDFLTMSVMAAKAPERGICPVGTFNCTPSTDLCLTEAALCDGVWHCENGHDESMCNDTADSDGIWPMTTLPLANLCLVQVSLCDGVRNEFDKRMDDSSNETSNSTSAHSTHALSCAPVTSYLGLAIVLFIVCAIELVIIIIMYKRGFRLKHEEHGYEVPAANGIINV